MSNQGSKEELDATLEAAFAKRLEGNEHFKLGEFVPALQCYHHVLLVLKGLSNKVQTHYPIAPAPRASYVAGTPAVEVVNPAPVEVVLDDGMVERVKKAIFLTYLNMSSVLIKTEKYKRALECAQAASKLDEHDNKSKFREAQARIGLGEVTLGKKLLQDLLKVTNDTAIRAELAKLEAAQKSSAPAASGFRGMYDRPSKVLPPPAAPRPVVPGARLVPASSFETPARPSTATSK